MTDPDSKPDDPARMKETLTRLENGDSGAADELFPVVYDVLRRLAGSRMKRERVNHTLRPTALVHEAYAKISGQVDAEVKSKTHFVAIASLAMQRILTDHARGFKAEKRGGGRRREMLHEDNAREDDQAVDSAVLAAIAVAELAAEVRDDVRVRRQPARDLGLAAAARERFALGGVAARRAPLLRREQLTAIEVDRRVHLGLATRADAPRAAPPPAHHAMARAGRRVSCNSCLA